MAISTSSPNRCSIAEARNHLPSLVHQAEAGQPVELTRRGRPVAALVSLEDYRRMQESSPGFWAALQRFRAEVDLDDLDVDAIYAGTRDRSPGREIDP